MGKWVIVLPERVTSNFFDYIAYPFRMFALNVWIFIGLALVLINVAARLPLLLQSPTGVFLALAAPGVRLESQTKQKERLARTTLSLQLESTDSDVDNGFYCDFIYATLPKQILGVDYPASRQASAGNLGRCR